MKFETPIFHPNVDGQGNICLDILKDKWSAVYSVQTILLSIQSLLEEPNNNSPLNGQAAEMWNRKEGIIISYLNCVFRFPPGRHHEDSWIVHDKVRINHAASNRLCGMLMYSSVNR